MLLRGTDRRAWNQRRPRACADDQRLMITAEGASTLMTSAIDTRRHAIGSIWYGQPSQRSTNLSGSVSRCLSLCVRLYNTIHMQARWRIFVCYVNTAYLYILYNIQIYELRADLAVTASLILLIKHLRMSWFPGFSWFDLSRNADNDIMIAICTLQALIKHKS